MNHKKISNVKPGQRPSASHMNEIVNAVNRLNNLNVGGNLLIKDLPGGPVIIGKSLDLQLFKVKDLTTTTDCVTCFKFDGDVTNSLETDVALPYLLRRTPFDEETVNGYTYSYTSNYERESDDGATTEDQMITPDYYTNALIIAVKIPNYLIDLDNDSVVWLDMNFDGRQWAKV